MRNVYVILSLVSLNIEMVSVEYCCHFSILSSADLHCATDLELRKYFC
jgi:hypothetical protein